MGTSWPSTSGSWGSPPTPQQGLSATPCGRGWVPPVSFLPQDRELSALDGQAIKGGGRMGFMPELSDFTPRQAEGIRGQLGPLRSLTPQSNSWALTAVLAHSSLPAPPLTLSWGWGLVGLELGQCRPLGVHQEVVEKGHLLLHLLNLLSVLVEDVLAHKLGALWAEERDLGGQTWHLLLGGRGGGVGSPP